MKVTLLGFKSVDFPNDRGERVQGITLFIAYPDENVVGVATEKKFIGQTVFDGFGISAEQLADSIDMAIDVEFGRKDKIVGLKVGKEVKA